eukprot:GHUV01044314.1.p1 GENE.GHUV01044314.1~~GHUV01044314.1.p1  ORF type:complete len:109 (+),score=14.91 GHUV01044314.1:594-920(+)
MCQSVADCRVWHLQCRPEKTVNNCHPQKAPVSTLLLSFNCRYGLGQIYMKQEKYMEALTHFDLATRINPSSSVLRCCCGTALRRMNRLEDALKQLEVRVRFHDGFPMR